MSDTLKDAYLLFSKKKYSDVIRILEPQVFRFRENFNFFYILGMSCLNQGDYGGAFSYLRRAVDIRENDINTLLGLAVIYLKRGDTGNALRLWLDIIDVDPGNVQAQRGLNYLKKNNEPDEFTSISSQDRIARFLPQEKRRKKKPFAAILISVLVIVIAAAVYFVPLTRDFFTGFFSKKADRPEISAVSLDERKDFVDLNGEFAFILTEKEIEDKFTEIQDYLYDFRDNMAQREINMLLLSNASEYVKNRARILAKYIEPPELINFRDNFSYQEVFSNLRLYDNCCILWKGKATNLAETTESIRFDFLAGYHEEKTLDGIIPVKFDFTIKIIPDQPIELLGKIVLDEAGNPSIAGISIRRLP